MENKRKLGGKYEALAAEYLSGQGYTVLEKNYRCRIGEIDLIARDGEYLVFVEVKYRKDTSCGMPEEAVDTRKQRVISRVADYYCMRQACYDSICCRFDVVVILGTRIQLIQNAFEYHPR